MIDDLATAPNFRDLGGPLGCDGRRVRSGLVFRSEALIAPDEADAAVLRAKGVVLVCDLRSDGERLHGPNRFWAAHGVELVSFDLLAGIPHAEGPWPVLRARPDAEGARAAMRAVYAAIPAAAAAHVAALMGRIADGDLPMLIHCTAGKDRTGFVSAVLLRILGVSAEEIMADYLASRGRWTEAAAGATRTMAEARTGVSLDVATLDAMMGVEPDYLDAAFDRIDAAYGGVEAYLAAAGSDAALLERVRDRLLA